MPSDSIRTSTGPCLSFRVNSSAPTLTSSPGMRISGSRLTLAATYRLAASLPSADQRMIILMTAVLGKWGRVDDEEYCAWPRGSAPQVPTDFELAARSCLTGLYVKLMLGRPSVVALSDGWEANHSRGKHRSAVKLRLEHVRAVSSTQAEYYFRPTLFALGRDIPDAEDLATEVAFRLTSYDNGGAERVCLWAVRKGMETQVARIARGTLPVGRGNLLRAIQESARGSYHRLESDLLGLDEWRFQEGLRIAFSMSSRPAASVGSGVD